MVVQLGQNYGAACTLILGQTTYIYRGCGTTYSNPNMRVEALPLTNGTEYIFQFTNTSTNTGTEVVSTNPYTTFGLAGVPQGTYNIRAKAKINGTYGAYATVCNIIYAVPLDTTKLLSSFCGTTIRDTVIIEWMRKQEQAQQLGCLNSLKVVIRMK